MQLSRFASKQSQRLCWGIRQFTVAAGVFTGFVGSASAQTAPAQSDAPAVGQTGIKTQPFAAPLFGQVPTTSPLNTTIAQNRPRFTLVPSLRTVYDTNVVRYLSLDQDSSARDNIRVTPGIDLTYNRLFGRLLVDINGSAGYDYNSRFKRLDQSRVNFNGMARAPAGAICSFVATTSYSKTSTDLNDTQSDSVGTEFGATSNIFDYGVKAGCERVAGFSPVGSFYSQHISRSRSRFFNSRRSVGNLGLVYSQPSVGTLSITAAYTQIRRPFIADLTGFSDDTNVYDFAVGIDRSVSPRLHFNVTGGLTKAKPQRAAVQSFTGASYSGRLEWLPTPRFIMTGTVARQVTNQNGISATYVIREDYALTAQFKASAKSQITLAGSRVHRDFRGESVTPFLVPLRTDKVSSLSANYNYDLTHRLRVGIGVSHRWRKAGNPIYDYRSTVLSSSIGAHF